MARAITKARLSITLNKARLDMIVQGLQGLRGIALDAVVGIHETENPFRLIGAMQESLTALRDERLAAIVDEERQALHEDGWRAPGEKL